MASSQPSQINAETIRCSNDRELFKSLLEDPTVRRTNEQIKRMEEKTPSGIRRRLLATSVRLSRQMAPDIHAMADDCVKRLEMDIDLDLYVYSSPEYNAACFKPENDRLNVMFSSSLLEAFEESELKFVIGHEFGHHVYRHHDIPIGFILRGDTRPSPRLALALFAWSRYAEVSADRAGAHCAQDIVGVSRALFKLASGLSGKTIKFNLDDFVRQVDMMQVEDAEPGQGAPKEDWFSTHPFSPLRVKALLLFNQSVLATPGGVSAVDLDMGVQGLMSLMEPSYLEGRTDTAEAMRRLLFAAAVTSAHADTPPSPEEIEVFERFFGEDSLTDGLDVEALKADLDDRIAQVKKLASMPQAMQVVRDLCLMAKAEGYTTPGERAVIDQVAKGLGVPIGFVTQVLASELGPD